MTLQKAFSERQLAKAKYTKRWKGPGGRYRYQYEREADATKIRRQMTREGFTPKKQKKRVVVVTKNDRKLLDTIATTTLTTYDMDKETKKKIDVLVEKGLVRWQKTGAGVYSPTLTSAGATA